MAKKTIKPVKTAKKAAKPSKATVKKVVKTAKKVAPVKKKKVEKAKPVTIKKAVASKGKSVAKKVVAKPVKKKIVKKAMPVKTVKKAVPAKKAAVKVTSVKKVVAKPVKKVAAKPIKKVAAKPVKKVAAKPVKKVTAKPVKKVAAKPVKKVAAKPVKKVAAKPVKKVAAKPVKKTVTKSVKSVATKKAPAKAIVKVVPSKTKAVKGQPAAQVVKTTPSASKSSKSPANKVEVSKKVIPSKAEIEDLLSEVKNLPIADLIADEPAKPIKKKSPVEAKKSEFSERPKPRLMEFKGEAKPAANPVFVVTPEGMANVKFAPVATLLRSDKKDSTSDMKTSNRFAFVEGDNKNSGITIENKLRALYDVQIIDSWIDKIHATRGELPLEVEDLENEVAGINVRVGKVQEEVEAALNEVAAKKQAIKDAEVQIKKYKEQLDKVKNNREYEALNKEIEFQDLEIQLFKKKIREAEAMHETKLAALEVAQQKLEARTNDLEFKKQQLNDIIAETEKEENILLKKSQEAKKLIDQRLLDAYERIRKGANNGLAVVPIDREASAGSFIHIPPQKQMDVAARKKVIIDEHSGRILVDHILASEETEKIQAILNKELGK